MSLLHNHMLWDDLPLGYSMQVIMMVLGQSSLCHSAAVCRYREGSLMSTSAKALLDDQQFMCGLAWTIFGFSVSLLHLV